MSNIHSGFVLPTGNAIQTALVAGNTALFQAYDVNSTTYRTLITMTANNDPTLDLAFLNSISAVANIDIGNFDLRAGTLTSDATIAMAGDLTNYEVVNDGSPEFRLGSADAEELHIQSVYDAGAQTLSHVLFQTDVASATADKGQFKFNVDGTEILRIDDGGIEVVGTVIIGTAFILTGGTNTFNLTNGTASLDIAAGATLNVDANLTVEATSLVNQDLTSDASPTFAGLALGVGNITMSGSIGVTGTRVTKGWFTDLEVTNDIAGDITGNAVTVTGLTFVSGKTLTVNNILTLAGTDSTVMTFPATSQTIAGLGVNQTFTAGQIITIANTVNQVGLTINQNDTTNNPIGLTLANTGTGNDLFLNQDGNGTSLNIDSEATTAGVFYTNAVNTGGVVWNMELVPGAASTAIALKLKNSGANASSGNLVFLDNDGASAVALNIDSEASTYAQTITGKYGLSVTVDVASGGLVFSAGRNISDGVDDVAKIVQDHASDTNIAFRVYQDGVGNAIFIDQNANGLALNIDKDCTVNDTRTWAMAIASDNAGTGTALGCGIDLSSFAVDEPVIKAVADAITTAGTLSQQIAIDIGGTTYYLYAYTTGS